MILLTVGTQLPFDRLVRAVDDWAGANPSIEIFGQIGVTQYHPSHFDAAEFVSAVELAQLASRAELLVSHAGMGSILTAMQFGKPIVVVPRRAGLAEHRNDHQLATASRFAGRPGITVVHETHDLPRILSHRSELSGATDFGLFASEQLISRLKQWVATNV